MTIARDLGYEVREEHLAAHDLYLADEAFLTGTAAEIVPIRSVDDREIGEPGEITRKIQETYFATVQGEVDRYKDWLEHAERMTRPRRRPSSVPARSRSTTRRCATAPSSRASRSPSTTSSASPSSSTGSGSTTSRPAGRARTRRTTSSSGARRRSSSSTTSTLVAFGSTRRVKGKVDSDDTLRHLVEPGTPTVCIVGKSWDYHVLEALQTTLDEGVAMVADSVEFLRADGLDGALRRRALLRRLQAQPRVRLRVLEAAAEAGATRLVLCDTNGGSLPHDVEHIVAEVVDYFGGDVGIAVHLHDDAGTGVANALAGVRGGAIQVQGTINGYGERTGNCNLTTIIPNLTLKMGIETIPADRLERLTPVAHHVAELVNMALNPQAAYVGRSAFAHKAGLHVSAIAKRPDAYEHVPPDSVGNGTRFVVSELAGKSTLVLKAKELGLELDGPQLNDVVDTLKRLEHEGYHFEVADGSLELLMRRATGWEQPWFEVESCRVITDDGDPSSTTGDATTEATSRSTSAGERIIATAEGNGPVNALDAALRQALGDRYPALDVGAPHRLQGAGARHARRAPARSRAC